MFFSEKYLLSTLKLANSIVFHLHAEAVSVNIELQHKYSNYIFEETDITTWKHYVNMSGEYHSLDLELLPDLIQVFVIEENTYMPLTKNLLETYKSTHQVLKNMDKEYLELINKYPEHETLIKGIIFPISMESIVNAEDGDILNYNYSFIEKQEYSLIGVLEKEIKNHIAKWHIPEYSIVDEYYIPALISSITAAIIKKILSHRLSKIGTEEAHSVFVLEFFKSNLSIHNEIEVLNDNVKLWLYKNLKYLIKNTGKDYTFNLLVKNVLNKSGIYVKELLVRNRLPIVNTDTTDLSSPTYIKNTENLFYVENGNYNKLLDNIKNKDILYKEVNDITYDTSTLIIDDERYTNTIIEKLSNPNNLIERTKVISIEYANLYNLFPTNIPEITLENWINNVFNSNTINYKNYTDPNTNITYYMSEKDAVLITLKHLLIMINKENVPITNIILSNVVSTLDNSENLLTNGTDVIDTVNNLLSKIVPYSGNNSEENINSIIEFFNLLWIYANDENNPSIMSDVSLIYERLKKPVVIGISNTPKTILEITENIIYNYGDNIYDYKASVIELIKTFTNINIDKHGEIDTLLNSFKRMIDKLTSYTVQTLTENLYASANVANEKTGIFRDLNIISVLSNSFLCLELIDLVLDTEANNFLDSIYVNNLDIVSSEAIFENGPIIDAEIINNELFELKVKTESFVIDAIDKDNYTNYFPYNLPFDLGVN